MSSILKERKLPQGWRWAQLGDVCDIISGQSPPSHTYRDTPEGLPFFQGKADFGLRNPTARVWCVAPKKIAMPNDILISVRAPVGPTNVADVECCIGRGLAIIRCKKSADMDFVLSFLKLTQEKISQMGTGSTFSSISRIHLLNLEILLPPLSEQKRIAADLNKKMAAVEKARAATLERVEVIRALPAAFLREIFSFDDGKLPQDWRWVSLSEICSFIRGVNFKKSVVSYIPAKGYLPILRAGNISIKLNTKDDLVWISRDRISKEQLLQIGDIVVCMSSGSRSVVGKTASLQKEWAGSVGAFCGIIRTKDIQHSQYLSLWFRSPNYLKWRDMQARGVNIQNLRVSEFEDMSIPLPPLSEQKRIVADLNKKMTAVEKACDAAEAESEATHALPAAFLREAFSGAL